MQTMHSSNPLESLDPVWAWSPWQPTDSEPWNTQRAGHLYRRAGFGASLDTLKRIAAGTFEDAITNLFSTTLDDPEFSKASEQLAQSALASNEAKSLGHWWLHVMLNTPTPLVEKLTLFWHGHFATGADKVKECQIMLAQNRTLREYAIGDLHKLVQAIAKDAAMLIYLDSAVNRKAHPNENFARELMELFCLGEGNYSERDVQELARCFTGWEVRRNQFRFNSFQHDAGMKSLLGHEQVESGEQAVEIVAGHPQTSRFIALKLFRFLIADEPTPPSRLIEPLAEQLRADNLQLAGTVRRILSSQLMFSPLVAGRKVRSPLDWALNWMKSCQLTTNLKKVSQSLAELGQAVFYPPNVKGWDGGRAWINSSTLVGRTNLISQLVREETTRWDGGTLVEFFQKQRVRSTDDLLAWIEERMLAVPLRAASRQRLLESMQAAGGMDRLADCLILAAALPEMQLM